MGGSTYARGLVCEIAAVAFGVAGWPAPATLAFGAAMGLLAETLVQVVAHEGRISETEKGVAV